MPVPPGQAERLSGNESWTGELPGFEFILIHAQYSPDAIQSSLAEAALDTVQSMQHRFPDLKHGIADTTVDNLPAKLIECTYTAKGTSSRGLVVGFDFGRDRWMFVLQGSAADKTIVEKFQRTVASIRVSR